MAKRKQRREAGPASSRPARGRPARNAPGPPPASWCGLSYVLGEFPHCRAGFRGDPTGPAAQRNAGNYVIRRVWEILLAATLVYFVAAACDTLAVEVNRLRGIFDE